MDVSFRLANLCFYLDGSLGIWEEGGWLDFLMDPTTCSGNLLCLFHGDPYSISSQLLAAMLE